MNFFETVTLIEATLAEREIAFELWDLQHARYVFGSWYVDYRINGHHVMFYYDGRDDVFGIQASEKHEKYPSQQWQDVYYGPFEKFLSDGIDGLKLFLISKAGEKS